MTLLNGHQKARVFYMSAICPRCDAPMKIKTIEAAMTFTAVDEVVYRCPACKIETNQTVMRDE
jgi:phage FluMu protein Com